ncbi:chromatin structure-remodeling complex subunit RSC9 [Rhizoctonia solani]|uniref:Chromatin structure-remodeling complex subunit RSC9 n=1 Tax=Rhizoctonia solani TaxID=456999 RepID=A0A0K6FZM7_9AGAM|nr:chromatin structure-remodeling complex subunit RSC9 [Rhizoctonia solani]
MPGSVDALFALADWYIDNISSNPNSDVFSPDKDIWTHRAHALEALLILRNSALEESNMRPILEHPYLVPFIRNALSKLQPAESHAEFVVYTLDILQALGPHLVLPPPPSEESIKRRKKKLKHENPLVPVARISEIAATSDDRALILSALSALAALFSVPENTPHIESCSQALDAALRYLPLTQDRPLITTSLDYLFAHLSYAPVCKVFLMSPQMPETVKLLVAILRLEQREEIRNHDLPPAPAPANAPPPTHKDYQLSIDELQKLVPISEPNRSIQWMQTIFVAAPDEEQTQVTLWSLYRDTFTPYSHQYLPLNASDVIRNVTIAFPSSQAMVFPGPPQRFVIRGIGRRQQPVQDRFKCRWNRAACTAEVFKGPTELHRHLEEHLNAAGVVPPAQCLWATCTHTDEPARLGTHVLTHVPASQSSEPTPHAGSHPNAVAYPIASAHSPETTSFLLTALLVLRLIWRAAIPATLHAGASVPKADEDHFGFPAPPGLLDRGTEEDEMGGEALEGEKRGVRAFKTVVERLQGVKMADDVLMSWITEMVESVGGSGVA